MLKRHLPFALTLLTVVFACAGVTRLFHSVGHADTNSAPAAVSSTTPNPKHRSHRSTIAKPPDRDSAFSTYNNPDYSLSFQYPRTFSLSENTSDPKDGPSPQLQSQLDSDQSGLILLAAIEIPDDAYPNTTFSSGHLQLAVNPSLGAPACLALAAPDDPEKADASLHESTGVDAIHGLVFHWRQSRSSLDQTDTLSRDYFVFANNTCYELFLEVTASVPAPTPASSPTAPADFSAPSATPDSAAKPADLPKILRTLEKSVSTFQLHYN
jgi:hypothetical protein